ncbi:transglutaminase domain-containing protein [Cyanobium sp. NIES-981]|uniref:transglutaminase family protein n=1 Tax=Cyanobium sp. NIES-981 TaxID=1851505 RepID=UPI0007DE0BB6|nr:transglutaminase domain-containing protein [Cyanobium sp. NIES-981]SBO43913.1 Transglutaminase domain protein [Cyanobium sp. NIES-981]
MRPWPWLHEPPAPRRLQWWAQASLALGCIGLDPGWLLSWFTLALVLAGALKLLEARSRPSRRLVALVQLIACGLLAAQQPGLLPSLQQLVTTVLALAGLLSLEADLELPWGQLLGRSLRVLAASLPFALVLFLLVPRLGPFGQADGRQGPRASTGLSGSLDPGSIAELASDDAAAARVAFTDDRPPSVGERYWRVLVHPNFDGRRWNHEEQSFGELPAGPRAARAGQLWLVEPSRFQAVPWDGRSFPLSGQLRSDARGELLENRPAGQTRAYQLGPGRGEPAWPSQPPSLDDLLLPAAGHPRLRALARGWAALPEPRQRLEAARAWFLAGGFRYDTRPGQLPERDGLDAFLFETRTGFCGHYASAFSALMRAAGVPARVVTGYLGGEWVVPLGGTPFLEVRQSDAHAWSEVWLPGAGWQRVDPSSWAVGSPGSEATAAEARARQNLAQWLQRQWWGMDVAWRRWWLGFDQAGQEALLQRLFADQRGWLGAVVLVALAAALALGLALLRRSAGATAGQDWLGHDLETVLRVLRRHGITPLPGESLSDLCTRAAVQRPGLAEPLRNLAAQHSLLRFAALPAGGRGAGRARQLWKLALRQLKRSSRGAIRQPGRSTP